MHHQEILEAINRTDLLKAFGLQNLQWGRTMLDLICTPPARRLAEQVLMYDHLVGISGLQVGSAWMLGQYVRRYDIQGIAHIPTHGPLLIAANHPGLFDTLLLMASIPRPDLRIIAAERPFLSALPHTDAHLIAVGDDPAKRQAAVRSAVRHLRAGGALLTFPAGKIEPDPAVLPGATESLSNWHERLTIFPRLVPNLTVVPAIVSGVTSPRSLRNPLIYLRRHTDDQHFLAATLQLIFPLLYPTVPQLVFGQPILAQTGQEDEIARAVITAAHTLCSSAATPHPTRIT